MKNIVDLTTILANVSGIFGLIITVFQLFKKNKTLTEAGSIITAKE